MTLYDFRGLQRAIVIDDLDFADYDTNAGALDVQQPLRENAVDVANGGTVLFGVLAGRRTPNAIEKIVASLAFPGGDAAELRAMRRIRKRGGYHSFAYWKLDNEFWTAEAGQQDYYLAPCRRNAHQVLFPDDNSLAWAIARFTIDGVDQIVNYVDGPTLTTPADGEVNIARDPHTSGSLTDLAEIRVGTTLAGGEELELEYVPLYQVRFTEPRDSFPEGAASQSTTFTLVER